MLKVLQDFLLSFCPADVRRAIRVDSPHRVLQMATWGGLAQFSLAGLTFIVRFKAYFAVRAQQLAPHMAGSGEVFQAGTAVIVTLEYLLHPLSLVLLYLMVEGLLRFMSGIVSAQTVPSFVVFLAFKGARLAYRLRNLARKSELVIDTVERLPDGRFRISTAVDKPHWNASITIGIGGRWYELEKTEQGKPPRDYAYVLRPAHAGKILRGFEAYDVDSALNVGAQITMAAENESALPPQKMS